ncbi:peroxisomal membrane protein 2-like [Denticeps clupeoides]|uniref:peroxisomal membrane protein 2-like n=1 Tax=Denticeps clupeoides TaxID=299321 RepID=UPI0010A552F0|nr:peroxisomal membrane protein 2-like [Denticeps clupeoides]XP_028824628.1 peroxisomal membrane protein 2-like [Denticeps clupeoides]
MRVLARLLQQYLRLLHKYPIMTKSITSGVLSALGNVLSQALEGRRSVQASSPVKSLDALGPLRFAGYGLCITGPCSHHFYQMLEVLLPASQPHFMVKRLLLDRLLYAPLLLLLFFLVMNVLEGRRWQDFAQKVRRDYLAALTMNWKVWTPFQFVNINYVPVQFRVLFSNVVALFWYAYLASGRK